MTREQAIETAKTFAARDTQTAAVFVKLDAKTKEPKDWSPGSAYQSAPKGYKFAIYVGVTGVIREVEAGIVKAAPKTKKPTPAEYDALVAENEALRAKLRAAGVDELT